VTEHVIRKTKGNYERKEERGTLGYNDLDERTKGNKLMVKKIKPVKSLGTLRKSSGSITVQVHYSRQDITI
jgi:hypothetical protein